MRPFQPFVLAVILVLWLLPAAEAPADSPNTQILNRAAKLLSDESYWNRADTRECPPNASKLSLYCALRHATEEVMGASSHRTAAMEEVRLVIEEKVGEKYDHRLMGYNNDPATKLADIHAVLKTAADRLDRRLAGRSEERRVGKEGRTGWGPMDRKKKEGMR